jgi:hypothetical protein
LIKAARSIEPYARRPEPSNAPNGTSRLRSVDALLIRIPNLLAHIDTKAT